MAKNDGGAAFPTMPINGDVRKYQGMSLRDYFAAKALPAIIDAYLAANGNGCAVDHAIRNAPALAYKYADAMLEAREPK